MKDEIKEILDNMKEISSFEYTTDWFELNYEDTKILLDYITNLQEENKESEEAVKYWQNQCDLRQRAIDKSIEEINYMITNADITEIGAIKLKQILGDKI